MLSGLTPGTVPWLGLAHIYEAGIHRKWWSSLLGVSRLETSEDNLSYPHGGDLTLDEDGLSLIPVP